MLDIIGRLEMVNAVTDGFPFICPVCKQEHTDWDYLRITLKSNPNPRCIHLRCLVHQMGFLPEEIAQVSTCKPSSLFEKGNIKIPSETEELISVLKRVASSLEVVAANILVNNRRVK